MLAEQVVAEGSLRAVPDGVAFDVRIPWYRSLPYSCVEGLEVTLDGRPIGPERLTIELGGERYRLDELPRLHDRWWYIADAAAVTVPLEEPAAAGEHELDVTISMRIPYIIESEVPLVMRERCVKTVTLEGAR
ncbi:MAG TPA: DUF6379 domain-containing protein [Solirubrobacteraceae bacterium]|nr:DUF6379 domain-containing protein [Solirubrobacteraceae bacterium]